MVTYCQTVTGPGLVKVDVEVLDADLDDWRIDRLVRRAERGDALAADALASLQVGVERRKRLEAAGRAPR